MKINAKKYQLGGYAPEQWLRSVGYTLINSEGQTSFVRHLGNGYYPRFHLYFTSLGEDVTFNLHLDQKKASYEGQTRHSGEYDGELVEREGARLKQSLGEDLFA